MLTKSPNLSLYMLINVMLIKKNVPSDQSRKIQEARYLILNLEKHGNND